MKAPHQNKQVYPGDSILEAKMAGCAACVTDPSLDTVSGQGDELEGHPVSGRIAIELIEAQKGPRHDHETQKRLGEYFEAHRDIPRGRTLTTVSASSFP